MTLYIRSDDKVSKVIVADGETDYAVASFYYQAGADNVPKVDARKLADGFIEWHYQSPAEVARRRALLVEQMAGKLEEERQKRVVEVAARQPKHVRAIVVHVYMSEDGYCGHQLRLWDADGKEYEGRFEPSHDRDDLVRTYQFEANREGWVLDLEHSEFKAEHESEI